MTICGLDEAGRGALSGPIVAAAVILPKDFSFQEKIVIRDSKTMSQSQREKAFELIQLVAISIQTSILGADVINTKGISFANKHIFETLIATNNASEYIVDGNLTLDVDLLKKPLVQSIVDADATHLPVICAGIVAKVTRDRIMHELHLLHPHYDWINNKGYGTKKHIEAIRQHGVSTYHRLEFANSALKNSTSY